MSIAIVRLRDNDAGIPAGAVVGFVPDSTTLSARQRTEFAHLKVTDAGQAMMESVAPVDPDRATVYFCIADLYAIGAYLDPVGTPPKNIATWYAQAGPMNTVTVPDDALVGNLYPPLPVFRTLRDAKAAEFGVGG